MCRLLWFYEIAFALIVSFTTSMASPCSGMSQGTGERPGNSSVSQPEQGNIFIIYNTAEDREEFLRYARQMARLRPFGRVDVCINSPALKSVFEIPKGSCDWHEYASYDRSVSAFFPDQRIAPFLPADFVAKNRDMLLYRAGILKNLGLNAAFRSNEPRFLPEAFFAKYPELRGPRVDHPRRSIQKEFAPCFHQAETVEMYHNMVGQLFSSVPGLMSLYFSMNDAGSGSCWCDWLYSGPNGPSACREINKSEGVVKMLNVYREEAKKQAGHNIDIYFKGMFTDEEKDDLVKKLPESCFLEGRNYPAVVFVSSMLDDAYPVQGLINPVQIIRSLRHAGNQPSRYVLDFWASYSRAHERIETIEKVTDILVDNFANSAGKAEQDEMGALKRLCTKWAGEEKAAQLAAAFISLDKVVRKDFDGLKGLSTLYWGISTRQVTRPLVFAPMRLKPEEEKYFLPHVFNVSIDEARNDYMDIHGGNRELASHAADSLLLELKGVWTEFGQISGATNQKFIDDMVKSLKLYACIIRTCCNFNDAQIIRNKHRDAIVQGPHRPDKIPTWTGDNDLLAFNGIMRDELDNTQEMINILEDGGLNLICYAKPPFTEDTFVLGPDLIQQLKTKRKIMLDHWTDIEGYLTTPFK